MTSQASSRPYAALLTGLSDAILADHPATRPYRVNYLAGHTRALKTNFPATRELLPENSFAALAQVYVQHYPPGNWDINLYGARFPELLAAQCHGQQAQMCNWQILAAVARLEYAIVELYYCPDSEAGDGYTISLSPASGALPETSLKLFRSLHPGTDISTDLTLEKTVRVSRPGLRVQVDNDLHPATGGN